MRAAAVRALHVAAGVGAERTGAQHQLRLHGSGRRAPLLVELRVGGFLLHQRHGRGHDELLDASSMDDGNERSMNAAVAVALEGGCWFWPVSSPSAPS